MLAWIEEKEKNSPAGRVCVKKQVTKSLMCLSRVSSEVESGSAGEGVVTGDSADLLDIF